MASVRLAALVVLAAVLAGCSGSEAVPPPTGGPAQLIKTDLQNAASTGQMGSEMVSIDQRMEELKASEPAKAAEVQKIWDELKADMNNPATVKAKANEIIQKLDGGAAPAEDGTSSP